MRIAAIVGARPQFIKAATFWRAVRDCSDIRHTLIHTGQHYDDKLSRVFFDELDLPEPEVNLGIGSARHGAQTGRMLEALEGTLLSGRPDWVLVYGDTNSTLAGALAAAKLHIPVAHVEAGLRSFNRSMPEELNRVLVDHMSSRLYAPTEAASENLAAEGIEDESVLLVGDVMFDAVKYYADVAQREARVRDRLDIDGPYILATIHRAENTDDSLRLKTLLGALEQVSQTAPVVFPAHPRTVQAIKRSGWEATVRPGISFIEPVGYLDMLDLERHASLVATDSGGIQKEAYFFKVPCVTLREETEWTELVETGWNVVCSAEERNAVADLVISRLGTQGKSGELYGDGNAARTIARDLLADATK